MAPALAALLLAAALSAVGRQDVTAASTVTHVVSTLVDENDGDYSAGDYSLREAVDVAAAGDMITFDPALANGTITLNGTQIPISRSVTISAGVPITISGNNASRIFRIANNPGPVVVLEGLVLRNGNAKASVADPNQYGGAISVGGPNSSGALTVRNSQIISNTGERGGGINVYGQLSLLTVISSTVAGNSANHAGGLYGISGPQMTVISSTLAHNTAINDGGAIATTSNARLDLRDSTLHDNEAAVGGALRLNGSTSSVQNSTLADNQATFNGGAIRSAVNLTLIHNTLSGNSVTSASPTGGIIHTEGANPLRMTETIIANSSAALGNCTGSLPTTDANNLVEGGGCGTPVSTADPLLGQPADNGGPTPTMALQAGSPAIDAAGSGPCARATDQRGITRPQGGACDIGAFEVEAPNAIELLSFDAVWLPGSGVRVTWETGAEWNHAGFNVYRSANPALPGGLVNGQIIASQGMQGQGAVYELLDRTASSGIWYYTLEDVDIFGVATPHGPVSVAVGEPTAVTLDTVAAQRGAGLAWGALLLVAATLVACVRVAARRSEKSSKTVV